MMKKLTFFLLSAAILVAASARASAGSSQFSADMTSTTQGQTIAAKIYVGDKKTRVEMPQATMIMRLDRGVSIIVMAEQGMYMEQPIDPAMAAQTSRELPGEMERKSLGKEKVNGRDAEKFLVIFSQNGRTDSVHQWVASEGFPVRTAALDGTWSADFKNIQAGPQPDSLFEPPAGYQKFEMPNMNAMMQQMNSGE
jgi:hypothetical protein